MNLPNPQHLAEGARAWAHGSYALEAAVELLIRHGVWLTHREFRRYAIDYVTATYTGTPFTIIDWQAAHIALNRGYLPCSGSEAAILRIALSLADGQAVELGPAITGLDAINLRRVVAAITHAHGNRNSWSITQGDPA